MRCRLKDGPDSRPVRLAVESGGPTRRGGIGVVCSPLRLYSTVPFRGPRALNSFVVQEDYNVPSSEEVLEKVVSIVSEQMGVEKGEVKKETSFVNDLNADSLDTVELVMEFEDEFDMSIPDEEAEKIQTVGDAVEFIMSVASKT